MLFFSKRRTVWVVTFLVLVPVLIGKAQSRKKEIAWNDALKIMQSRHSLFLNGFKASFRLALVSKSHDTATIPKSDSGEPSTPNRAYSVFWAAKGPIWRSEIAELYPSEAGRGSVLYCGGYNGERYYAYDGRRNFGVVTPDEHNLDTGIYLMLSYEAPDANLLDVNYSLRKIENVQKLGVEFQSGGLEMVNNSSCVVYVAKGQRHGEPSGPFRYTFWLDPDKGYSVVRFKDEQYITQDGKITNGSVSLYSVQEFEGLGGENYVPKHASYEQYTVRNSKLELLGSETCVLDKFELDPRLSTDYFEIHFAPGTPVVDDVEDPGHLSQVGGSSDDVLRLAQQKSPSSQQLPEGASVPDLDTHAGLN